MNMRRSAASLAVAAAAMADIALTPGVANASTGGGCVRQGLIEACVSASGKYVEPDFYVLASIPGCSYLGIQVNDDTSGTYTRQYFSGCATGHHGPYPLVGTNGHQYSVLAFAQGTGGTDFAVSKELTFSD